ncbi:TraI domain-containing protein [Serratia ureilytica]|uniref:TraI domain-containing protein n=1 Tax=Serratia ureilytica TaxID=300181 RepID=UPI003267209B
MLKAIKELLVGTRVMLADPTASSSASQCPPGYFKPASAEQLLSMESRQQCLQQLWESSALPQDLYEHFYLQPLKQFVSLMQVLPATSHGEYAWEGGLVDVTLKTTTYAVRLAKGHMLPPGATPEEQSAQNVQWNVVVFYAALWHYLPLLSQQQGELQSGRSWLPGLTVPSEPYRFRFRSTPLATLPAASQSAMIAARLLPEDVIKWLSTLPAAIHSLMTIAIRQPSTLPVIDDIILCAAKLAQGDRLVAPSLSASISSTLTVASLSEASDAGNIPSSLPTVTVSSSDSFLVDKQFFAEVSDKSNENVSPVTDVLLNSALDVSAKDEPLTDMSLTPEKAVRLEEDTEMRALLSLMAVEVSVPTCLDNQEEGNAPQKESLFPEEKQGSVHDMTIVIEDGCVLPDVIEPELLESTDTTAIIEAQRLSKEPQLVENNVEDILNAESNVGNAFLQWLSLGVQKGDISVNTIDSRAHIVSGFVFLCVPDIFYLYIKENKLERIDRNSIQKSFEKMGRHRIRKGRRFFIGYLYEKPEGEGTYRRINGYLIKAHSLYGGTRMPEDSQLLVIP